MSVGETLAHAREARGLSIDDVSQQTRIRSTIIRAIESDEFAICGGEVYARGHIRSIGHVVGIDPEPLVEEFDREHGGPPAGPVPLAPFDPVVTQRTERRRPNWAAAMVAALVIVIALAAAELVGGGGKHGRQPLAAPSTSVSTSPSPSPTPSASAKPPVVAQLPTNGVTVLLRIISDRSWCQVTNSQGAVLYEGVLTAGQSQVFRDSRKLRLVLGNAGAVDLVVNGRDLGSPGGPGYVARVEFGPGAPGTPASG